MQKTSWMNNHHLYYHVSARTYTRDHHKIELLWLCTYTYSLLMRMILLYKFAVCCLLLFLCVLATAIVYLVEKMYCKVVNFAGEMKTKQWPWLSYKHATRHRFQVHKWSFNKSSTCLLEFYFILYKRECKGGARQAINVCNEEDCRALEMNDISLEWIRKWTQLILYERCECGCKKKRLKIYDTGTRD